jgi:putative FmdB family regulatory protein
LSMVTTSSAMAGTLPWVVRMPIYEYKCEKGHVFEAMQRMTDEPLTKCEKCGAPVQRVFHPVAVHFKGKGFYNTDYGTKRRAREMEKSASDGADKTDAKAKEKSKESTKDAKPASSGDKK